jgi:zinc transporter ZupT
MLVEAGHSLVEQVALMGQTVFHTETKDNDTVQGVHSRRARQLPPSLIVPVVIDAAVDGFMIGVCTTASLKAGCIMAVATSLEMGFLGMAVAIRVSRCKGSSVYLRYLSLLVPPLVMWATANVGYVIGTSVKAHPLWLCSFLAFGVVALLHLIVDELLPQGKKFLNGQHEGASSAVVLLGLWIVVMMDQIGP